MPFTNAYINTLYLALIAFIFILFFLISRIKKKTYSIKFFLLLLISVGIWIISDFFADNSKTTLSGMFWSRFALVGPILVGSFFLNFSRVFPNKESNFSKKFLIISFVPAVLLLFFVPTKFNIESVTVSPKGLTDWKPGYLYAVFNLFLFFTLGFGIVKLFITYRHSTGISRSQILLLIFGFSGSISIAVLSMVILPLFGLTSISILGPFATILFLSSIAYSLVKHRLFGIKFVVGRTLYVLLIALFPFGTFYIIYALQQRLWGTIFSSGALITGFFFSIIFVYILLFANNQITKVINEKIINSGFDPQKAKDELIKTLSTLLELDKVVTSILSTIHTTIAPVGSGVIIFDINNRKVLYRRIRELHLKEGLRDLLEIIAYWDELTESPPIIREEIDLEEVVLEEKQKERLKRILTFMKEKGIAAVFPLNRKVQLNGILLLGNKSDESAYTIQDVNFLESIVANSSVAIGRSLLYKQVADFAENLEEKVDIATKELADKAKELNRKNVALKKSSQRERDMMDIVGHELRTPATIVKNALGYIELLMRLKKLSHEKMAHYTKLGLSAIEREIKLINTFLGATKIEGGQMQLDPIVFSLIELTRQSVGENRELASQKGLKLVYLPPKNKIPSVEADRTRINEVIDNFISNSIKYTHKGKIEVWCDANSEKETVSVFVKDTGLGISDEDKTKLFRKFGRLKNYVNDKQRMTQVIRPGGTGLGLFLCKGIITLHGGEITVDSTLGKGSTFSFTIPVKSKISKKNLINPIFSQHKEHDVFVKMGFKKEKDTGEDLKLQ
jgi:signal transduction histidine kinase